MPAGERMSLLESGHGSVSVAFDGPASSPVLAVLAHGANAGMHTDFMVAVARGLAARGVEVCRFNFPYIERGRRAPDRQGVLEESFRAVVQGLGEAARGRVLVVGGKSLGGRIASHVVGNTDAAGLVLLGYPLHPPGKPERLRAVHLASVAVPTLFVEGSRDPLCPLDSLRGVLKDLSAPVQLAVIEDGDHSFRVRRSSGRTTDEAWQEVAAVTADWVMRLQRETASRRQARA